jgi:hypothetical protein
VTYVVQVTDGDIEALMGALKRDDPLQQNRKLRTVRNKLVAARVGCPPMYRQSRYGWENLLRGENPIAVVPPTNRPLNHLCRKAHEWARYRGLRVTTRQRDGALYVWLLGKRDAS